MALLGSNYGMKRTLVILSVLQLVLMVNALTRSISELLLPCFVVAFILPVLYIVNVWGQNTESLFGLWIQRKRLEQKKAIKELNPQ